MALMITKRDKTNGFWTVTSSTLPSLKRRGLDLTVRSPTRRGLRDTATMYLSKKSAIALARVLLNYGLDN
jgi:hypothetical protein